MISEERAPCDDQAQIRLAPNEYSVFNDWLRHDSDLVACANELRPASHARITASGN